MKAPLTQTAALRRRCQRILAGQRRRAKQDGRSLDYGLDELLAVVSGSPRCDYCNSILDGSFSMDHLLPIARGGQHVLGNQVVCCQRCNRLKGKMRASEFRQLLALLGTWHPAAREDVERRLLSGSRIYATSRRKKTCN